MRTGSALSFALIGLSVVLSVCGQLVLKLGVGHTGAVGVTSPGSAGAFLRLALLNPLVLAGFLIYGLSAVSWLIVLSRLNFSYAYPFLALNFIFIALVSRFILNEPISAVRWAGILLICAGVAVVGRY